VWTGDPAKPRLCGRRTCREIADPSWETADRLDPMAVPANSLLLIENLLDHLAFLSAARTGISAMSRTAAFRFELHEGTRDGKSTIVGTIPRGPTATGSHPFSKITWIRTSSTVTTRITC